MSLAFSLPCEPSHHLLFKKLKKHLIIKEGALPHTTIPTATKFSLLFWWIQRQ